MGAARLDSSDGNYRSMIASCRDSVRQCMDSVRYSMKLAGNQLEQLELDLTGQELCLRSLRACRGLPRSVRERVSSLVRAREERRGAAS